MPNVSIEILKLYPRGEEARIIEAVHGALMESAPENWGIRGGVPASEVDLGFRIDV